MRAREGMSTTPLLQLVDALDSINGRQKRNNGNSINLGPFTIGAEASQEEV